MLSFRIRILLHEEGKQFFVMSAKIFCDFCHPRKVLKLIFILKFEYFLLLFINVCNLNAINVAYITTLQKILLIQNRELGMVKL